MGDVSLTLGTNAPVALPLVADTRHAPLVVAGVTRDVESRVGALDSRVPRLLDVGAANR